MRHFHWSEPYTHVRRRRLLDPRSLAVIGASLRERSFGAWTVRDPADFKSPVYPVNPKYAEVGGRRCHADRAALPEVPDCTIVVAGRDAVEDLVRACTERWSIGEGCGRWVQRARRLYAARALGVAEESLRIGIEWARERLIFGKVLAAQQATQFAVANSRIEIDAACSLVGHAARLHDNGRDERLPRTTAAAKLHALEAWYRDLRVARILEGSSKILRTYVARAETGPIASAEKKAG